MDNSLYDDFILVRVLDYCLLLRLACGSVVCACH